MNRLVSLIITVILLMTCAGCFWGWGPEGGRGGEGDHGDGGGREGGGGHEERR